MKSSSWPVVGVLALVMRATELAAQPSQPSEGVPASAVNVRFTDRPSLRLGRSFRVDLTAKLQADLHRLAPAGPAGIDDSGFDLARRRVGVEGALWKRVEFEVERELGASRPWRDAFVNVIASRGLQVRAGQFKMPFGMDQLTSGAELDFVYRSRLADLLAPGRSVGGSVHGRLARRAVGYDLGLFSRDGDTTRVGSSTAPRPTLAGRLTVRPFRLTGAPRVLNAFEAGVNGTSGHPGGTAFTAGPSDVGCRLLHARLRRRSAHADRGGRRLGRGPARAPGRVDPRARRARQPGPAR